MLGFCMAALANLVIAPHAPHLRSRIKKDFDLGIGKDDRSNVASFHDYAAFGAHLLLPFYHGMRGSAETRSPAKPRR